ncbi:MAG: hypothetical protein K9K79_03860 [Desulfohalobiaceae bacterium]|nr:hypothetical protein [Desulfohalobiaceae bacterium]
MIFRRKVTKKGPGVSIEDPKIRGLYQVQKELDAARAPDFSSIIASAKRRTQHNGSRLVKGLSALLGPQRVFTLALCLLLLLTGALIVQWLTPFRQSNFDTLGAAKDIVNWQPPSTSLFTSSPQVWFLEDNWDWQSPTDNLLKTYPRVSFLNGDS